MQQSRSKQWPALAAFVALCLGVGAIGGWVTAEPVAQWYPSLQKPWFDPPAWVFGPVWTVLYVMMAIAAWQVYVAGDRAALTSFYVQLGLNLLWSVVFFGLRSPGLALIEIVFLWLAVAVTTAMFMRVRRSAGWLMVPYLAWVSFAAVLNAAIWRLN